MFKEGLISSCFYKIFLYAWLFGFCTFQARASSLSPEKIPDIRVLIAKDRDQVRISGLDIQRTLHITNQTRDFSGRKGIRFNCRRFGEKNRQHITLTTPLLLASLTSKTGLLTFKGQRFHGKLKVISGTKGSSCNVIHATNLEDYIATLLAKEMNASWPIEALKAQAVAARTYAYSKIMSRQVSRQKGYDAFYDLESSESHQVSGSFFDATARTLQASRETFGQVLKNEAGLITEIFFHAKCGGHTIVPENVWSNKVQGYQAVEDPYCHGRGGDSSWKTVIAQNRVVSFFNWLNKRGYVEFSEKHQAPLKLNIAKSRESSPIVKILIDGHIFEFKKSLLRRYFGRVSFQSNNFKLEVKDGNFLVEGEGRGHGVGMCQIGALSMADQGKKYRNILKHYFPGHQIQKIY